MINCDREPLSAEVIRRKGVLLDELTVVLADRVRTRRTRRATAAAAVLAVVATILTLTVPSPHAIVQPGSKSDPRFEIIFAVSGDRPLEVIDDDQLLDELRAAGIDAGIFRTADQVFLVSR